MPKKVDHDRYRLEIAQQAAALFSEHGYTGLGMRKIATELGISKSALYHYFPSKQVLFHACTDLMTRFEVKPEHVAEADEPISQRIASLIEVFKEIEPIFPNELSLLIDYLRGRDKSAVAEDKTMQLANNRYALLVEKFVDKNVSKPVLCLLLGTLLMRYFDGETTDFNEIEAWLVEVI